MKSKKRQLRPKSLIFVKLESLDDLSRYVCNYDYTNAQLVSFKSGGAYRIFALGEEIGKSTIAYYVSNPKSEHAIGYTYPSSPSQKENSHFVSGERQEGSNAINIICIDDAKISDAKPKAKEIPSIAKLSSVHDLVTAALIQASGTETIPQIYSFVYKGKAVLCAFDVIEGLSDENKILYYSLPDKNQSGGFVRYKYSDNRIDFTEYMGEHSYMYAKIIHLAEPFPFFKMPD